MNASRQDRPGSCGKRTVTAILLGSLVLSSASAQTWTSDTPGLERLARALGQAPAVVRRDFARSVLVELAAIHTTEADRARAEARRATEGRDLFRWASATSVYAGELQQLAQGLAATTPVRIGLGIGPVDGVYLDIDGRLVMVSSPRPRQQASLEQRVIERFCKQHRCDTYLADYQPPPAVVQPVAYGARWSFSQHAGPVCSTDDGLVFQFSNMTDLEHKRRACSQVVAELNALAALVIREAARGIRIDWNRLAIQPVTGEERHLITLNGDGDSASLLLPALAQATAMFRQVRPWLAARVDGNRYRLVVLNCEQLMAALLQGEN